MKVNIEIKGQIEVASDDIDRLSKESAPDLVRVLVLRGAKIQTRVTEIYQKGDK